MAFASSPKLTPKSERARLLALALSTLLIRGGERVGLTGLDFPPRAGELQLLRLSQVMADATTGDDYGTPESTASSPTAAPSSCRTSSATSPPPKPPSPGPPTGASGAILQILDPQEEAFPFDGRTIFEIDGPAASRMKRSRPGDLRGRYLERLAERKDRLARLARATGWQYDCHHTDRTGLGALLWLYRSLERVQH